MVEHSLNLPWPWITDSAKCSSSLGDTSSMTGSSLKSLTSTAFSFVANKLCPWGSDWGSWRNDCIRCNPGVHGGGEELSSWGTECWLWRDGEAEEFPESEYEAEDCCTCEARAQASEAPAAAARCRRCDDRCRGSSWKFVSAWSPHSDGAREVGAKDPVLDTECENIELREDETDEVAGDGLSNHSIRGAAAKDYHRQ